MTCFAAVQITIQSSVLYSIQVVQHFIHCIESHGRHVQYLRFLHAIVKAESQYVRKTQDIVMAELVNMGEDVLLFYNDRCLRGFDIM